MDLQAVYGPCEIEASSPFTSVKGHIPDYAWKFQIQIDRLLFGCSDEDFTQHWKTILRPVYKKVEQENTYVAFVICNKICIKMRWRFVVTVKSNIKGQNLTSKNISVKCSPPKVVHIVVGAYHLFFRIRQSQVYAKTLFSLSFPSFALAWLQEYFSYLSHENTR
jgi:hypothetical protein